VNNATYNGSYLVNILIATQHHVFSITLVSSYMAQSLHFPIVAQGGNACMSRSCMGFITQHSQSIVIILNCKYYSM